MGFRRFRNTLVVAIAITVVLSAAFLLKVSSPPGFAAVAAVLLVGRWLLSLRTSSKTDKNAAVKKDPNEVRTVQEFRETGEVSEIGKGNKSHKLATSTSHKAALMSLLKKSGESRPMALTALLRQTKSNKMRSDSEWLNFCLPHMAI